ncbi:MAG: Ig-like domain-containing protein [Gemmatimonadaceae bacterium]
MRRSPTRRAATVFAGLFSLALAACGGGGDGGTPPPTVASVVITAPATPPTFQTLTRTVQFTAVARDAASAPIAGATITWSSSNNASATVSASGLVTAVANGSAQITATSGGVPSPSITVTVSQVASAVTVTPASVAFGALGSTRQLAATSVDSSGAPVAGAAAATWTRVGTGISSVSAGGLAAALSVGIGDTAVATIGARTGRVPISVSQVVASLLVSTTGSDTLRTTGRTKTYTAAVRDSQLNTIPGVAVTWSSNATGVATVGTGTGVATAVDDGTASITATASAVSGTRALTVRRFAQTFTLTPGSGSITTPLGTNILLGTVRDSVNTDLPITWASRSNSVLTVSPTTGAQTTATGRGNGNTFVVMSGGTRSDSTLITVTGQASAPLTANVNVGPDNFFRSPRNSSQNPAVDTVAVGGSVTWAFLGGLHSAQSTGSPSFTSSANLASGTYAFTFAAVGTYTYNCAVHGDQMTGRIVVR